MPRCIKCDSTMRQEGNTWVCPNLTCTYWYRITQRILSQGELLEKVKEQATRIVELENLVKELTK